MMNNEDDKNNNGSINNNATTNLKDQMSSLTKTNNYSIKPCSDCRNLIQWHTLDL